jgi:hypothetical protein
VFSELLQRLDLGLQLEPDALDVASVFASAIDVIIDRDFAERGSLIASKLPFPAFSAAPKLLRKTRTSRTYLATTCR